MAQPKNINNAILSVLESIDAKLDGQEKQTAKLNTNLEGMANTGVVSEKEYEAFAKFFGDLAKGITTLVKVADKISDKSAEKIKTVLTSIGEGISSFFKDVDAGQMDEFASFLRGLGPTILLFAVSMTLALPFLLIAPIAAALLGLTIKVFLLVLPEVSEKQAESLAGAYAILQMGKGALLFGLAMTLYLPLAIPAFLGAMAFAFTVKLLLKIFMGASNPKKMKAKTKALEAIFSMAKGILLFGLSMILFLVISPVVILGAVMFGVTIFLMMTIINAANKNGKKSKGGIASILDLAKGILLFALAMIVTVLLFPIVILGALFFALTLLILNLGLRLVQGKKARKGVISLLLLGLAILAFALVISLFDSIVTWGAILKVAVTIAGLGLILAGLGIFNKLVRKGAIAMLFAAGAVVAIAIAMLIWKVASPEWMDIGKLAATVFVVGLIGLLAGLGPIPGFIMAGSAAMIVAAGAVLILSIAMMIWTSAKVGWEDVGILGATVAMIGIEMGLLGFAAPFIFVGAAAMAFAAIPLIAITGALAVFKATKWKESDGDMLVNALSSVTAGFMGGRMPGGFLAAIKFAAGAAARAALMFITVPPFILAGLALVPIAMSLKKFKEAKWTSSDSENMEMVMAAIISSFALPSDYARQKKLGIYVTPWRLMLGIYALRNAGDTMASLAAGIQAFANLTVPIYGWVDKEGGGSLEIIERRQMNEGDFDKAAYGMAKVISAISKPFAEVGRLEQGSATGNPILDAIFSGNFVSKGVSALKNSGEIIVGLAEGVQSFAELSIPVYGLVDYTDENGNTNKKLMVIEKRPMTEGDIETAAINISKVIGVIADALADVGRKEANSEGWFSGGFVSKGAESLAGVGDNIKAIADTVQGYAFMEIRPMELINAGTKDAKLVPGKPIVLTDADLTKAANTLSKVIGIIVNSIAKVGKLEKESKGWFSDGFVTAGKNALGNIGQNIKAIADSVIGFATASFTPMGPDKDGNLVPIGKTVKLGSSQLKAAARTLGDVISLMGWEVYYFGKDFSGRMWALEAAVDAQSEVTNVINKVTESLKKLEKVTIPIAEDFVKKVQILFTGLYDIFSPENAPQVAISSWFFKKFSRNLVNIAREAGGVVKAGQGFSTMADATMKYVREMNKLKPKYFDNANATRWLVMRMGEKSAQKGAKTIAASTVLLKSQINGLDIERLKILNSLMCALAKLGNANVGLDKLGEEIGEGMKEGFELLAEYLKEIMGEMGGGGEGAGAEGGGSMMDKFGGGFGAKPKAGGGSKPAASGGGGDMAKALKSALQSVTLKVKPAGGAAGTF